jgi:lipocalin
MSTLHPHLRSYKGTAEICPEIYAKGLSILFFAKFLSCQFEIIKFADEKKYAVEAGIEETFSGTKKVESRRS